MSVANLDLQISGGGHLDPEVRGGGGGSLRKMFFRPFGPHFGRRIRRAGPRAPSLDPPLSVVAVVSVVCAVVQLLQLLHYTLTIC